MVPRMPSNIPTQAKAFGIANKPVPAALFTKFANEPKSLKQQSSGFIYERRFIFLRKMNRRSPLIKCHRGKKTKQTSYSRNILLGSMLKRIVRFIEFLLLRDSWRTLITPGQVIRCIIDSFRSSPAHAAFKILF